MKRHLITGGISAAMALAFFVSTPAAQDAKPPMPAKAKKAKIVKPIKRMPGKPIAPAADRAVAKKKSSAAKIKPMPVKKVPMITFSGKIVDADGNPVEGATVSSYFNNYTGTPRAFDFGKSDANGAFSTEQRISKTDTVLYVIDGKGNAATVFVPKEGAKDLVITLVPERKFTFDLIHFDPKVMDQIEAAKQASKETEKEGEVKRRRRGPRLWSPSIVFYAVDDDGNRRNPRFMYNGTKFAKAELSLAPGTYDFYILGSGCSNKVVRRTIEAGEGVQELETVKLEPTIINQHMNKAAPALSATHVRKLGKEIKAGEMLSLEDYKGKWVVLEFWGFW